MMSGDPEPHDFMVAMRRYFNYGLIACGILGTIVVITLPMREAPTTIRLFDAGGYGVAVVAALLTGAAMGASNFTRAPARWPGIIAAIAFAIAHLGVKESGGGKGVNVLVGIGANVGLLLSFLGTLLAVMLAWKLADARS